MNFEIFTNKNREIVFFPKSLRTFKINENMKKLLTLLEKRVSKESITNEMGINDDEYEQLLAQLRSYDIISGENEQPTPKGYLKRLSINVSNNCNMNCAYCYANFGCYGDKEKLMNLDILKTVLDKFYDNYLEIGIIQVFGGEPFLNIQAFEFIGSYIEERIEMKKNKYKTQINTITNGTIVNSRVIKAIQKYNINVTVSLDGPKEIHDKNRQYSNHQGTYDIITKNIIKLKHETNQPTQIEVTYNNEHVIQNYSILDIVKYIKNEFQDVSIHIAPVSASDTDCFALLNREPFIDSVDEIYDSGQSDKLNYHILSEINRNLKQPRTQKRFCDAGVDLISVSATGDIYPCYMFIDQPQFLLLNINDELFSREYIEAKTKEFYDYNRQEQNQESACENCYAMNVCSGCMGINYYSTGNIHQSPDAECYMRKEMLKKVLFKVTQID